MPENIPQGNAPQTAAAQPAAQVSEGMPQETSQVSSEVQDGGQISEDDIDSAEASGELSKKEAAALKKKLKIKVDGEEFEEEVNWEDEESIKRHLQKSKAFDKRVKEFTGYKSQVEQALSLLEKDPEAFLEKAGINVDDFAKNRLEKKIKELEKSPDQLKNEKMEAELNALKEEKQRIQEEKNQIENEKLRTQIATEIENELIKAYDSKKTILNPKDPRFLYRVAQTMQQALDSGYNEVTIADVIPIVDKQFREESKVLFDNLPEELLEELVGKHNLDRLRQKRLANKPRTDTAKQISKDQGIKTVKESDEDTKRQKRNFNKFFSYKED